MPLKRRINAGGIELGEGCAPLFLPDIGTFFGRDVECGMGMVDQVAAAGAAFVKGEVLHDASICRDTALMETLGTRDQRFSSARYRDVIESKVVPLADYERLFRHARSRGLRLALSVYDETGLRFALAQGAELVKIASSNIVHQPLIAAAAASGRPVIVDTGLSTFGEIVRAVEWFVQAGGEALVLEHSPPAPPAPASGQDLGAIALLREVFRCPVGLSDHHAGEEMLHAAAALGAHVLEKGVCLDDAGAGQDVAHALPIGRLAATLRQCANVHAASREPPRSFRAAGKAHAARMGIFAARDLPAMHRVEPSDLSFAFPAAGIGVQDAPRVVGARLREAVARGAPLLWSHLVLEDR
jgi:sialic acid synthase SpsE